MGFITVTVKPASVKVDFGDYFDPQSAIYTDKGYSRIDGLEPRYPRKNINLIKLDKENPKVVWLQMKDSMSEDWWPLTYDQTFDPTVEGMMAFIVDDIGGTNGWANASAFADTLEDLMVN